MTTIKAYRYSGICSAVLLFSCTSIPPPSVPEWKEPSWVSSSTKQVFLSDKSSDTVTQETEKKLTEDQDQDLQDFWQRKIDIQFHKTDFAMILKGLSSAYGFSYGLSATSTKFVSYQAQQIALEDALEDMAIIAQVNIEKNQKNIHATQGHAFWRHYQVPYLNLTRSSVNKVKLSQQITATGNQSDSGIEIMNTVSNNFWDKLTIFIEKMASVSGSQVAILQETGTVSWYGSLTTHRQIRVLIDNIVEQAHRQVFIEIAIVEVELSDQYEAGIDWSVFDNNSNLSQETLGQNLSSAPRVVLGASGLFDGVSLNFGARLVERFGTSKIISSPQLLLLNNQTAALKVVDNVVYFNFDSESIQTDSGTNVSFRTVPHSVAVGLIISITPFIHDDGSMILSLKPSISRVFGYVDDPHPLLAENGVQSQIPIIREREMSSILKVKSTEVAIIGGLMQNSNIQQSQNSPGLGGFLGYESDAKANTELVLFLRASLL